MASLLVLGGARSGKSRYVLAGHLPDGNVTFVATAEARDADMAARIARHRADRPAGWHVIEEPRELPSALAAAARARRPIVVDCLTLWVANLMDAERSDAAILRAAAELAGFIPMCPVDVSLVSNEVGEGVVPPTEDGRRFRDVLGEVNQRVAAVCERVVLMIAGLPLTVKEPPRTPGELVQAP